MLFILERYMELSLLEKQKFLVEFLFNIFQYDFNDEEINIIINQKLNVYDYYYSLNLLYFSLLLIQISWICLTF